MSYGYVLWVWCIYASTYGVDFVLQVSDWRQCESLGSGTATMGPAFFMWVCENIFIWSLPFGNKK